MFDEWEITEEGIQEGLTRLENLLCLLELREKGYNIEDYYFGFCGCGE